MAPDPGEPSRVFDALVIVGFLTPCVVIGSFFTVSALNEGASLALAIGYGAACGFLVVWGSLFAGLRLLDYLRKLRRRE